MNNVNCKRIELIAKLKENREKHRGTFEKALHGYRAAVIAELEVMIGEAKAGKRIRRQVGLIEPMDQTRDYDRAITMLEMSVDDVIELSQADFACFVMDDWAWKQQFTTSTMSYV